MRRDDRQSHFDLIDALEKVKADLRERLGVDQGFPSQLDASVQDIDRLIGEVQKRRSSGLGGRELQAEVPDEAAGPEPPASMRGRGLAAEDIAELRPHVIDLNQGFFADDGEFTTTAAQVDQLFDGLRSRAAEAKAARKTLNLLFYAHGGLVDKDSGLHQALDQRRWWLDNDIYPIFFVWETGLWNTVEHLLAGVLQRSLAAGARSLTDTTTDPLLELLARAAGGPKIWGGMKLSALAASQRGAAAANAPAGTAAAGEGGAHYVARRLRAFLKQAAGDVELHALGHSAGAIFHSYFMPTVLDLVPDASFKSLHLLAPAIRIDAFKERLLPLVGADNRIERLTMYSMKTDLEKADNCAGIYRKSLLYLIYYALEDHRRTDLLGLEESVWRDAGIKAFFGLDGATDSPADAIWSQTPPGGDSASRATSHGGFHDDRSTMESVVRRIRALPDTVPVSPNRHQTDGGRNLDLHNVGLASKFAAAVAASSSGVVVPGFAPGARLAARGVGGRRRALCVGINAYPGVNALFGCVADAQLWTRTLQLLGFEVQTMVDATATYDGIKAALSGLIADSAAGDVVVFQYAGHGTQVPDPTSAQTDEAIVPVDFSRGALLLDKELRAIYDTTPQGVNLTCFLDCCHSGDLDRELFAGALGHLARRIVLTKAQMAAYQQFARRRGPIAARSLAAVRGDLKDVSFAACQKDQVAYENGGQGDFTLRTTRLLQHGLPAATNREFCDQIVAAFGAGAQQLPRLDGGASRFAQLLLLPLTAASAATPADGGAPAAVPAAGGASPEPAAPAPNRANGSDRSQALHLLAQLAELLAVDRP